jgi:murein L,D-transpeptidase YcbB/YkuD
LLPPAGFPSDWAQRPQAYDAPAELARALAENRLPAWLAGLAPPSPAYARLQLGLARYRAIAEAGGWPQIGTGKPLELRAEDDRVPLLRQRLAIEDPDAPLGEGPRYDEFLAQGVAGFQARHGLNPTGKVDRKTLAELNVPVQARLAQITANLERRRWAPRVMPATRIEVNIAGQTLEYYREGAPALTMRTIVGRPSDRTPIFSDMVSAVVFNPPWNVPTSIATKEIWPKARRDPGYLARNDFVVTSDGGLQQRPGPTSALGRVKFDLPNRFNVYLHDTPNHGLFAGDERALSHGCIRLDRPVDLARLMLDGDADWTPQAIQKALEAGVTVRAVLSRPVPVSIAYWTAFVDDAGEVNFRRDLYGWDAKLLMLRDGRL